MPFSSESSLTSLMFGDVEHALGRQAHSGLLETYATMLLQSGVLPFVPPYRFHRRLLSGHVYRMSTGCRSSLILA
jgi:hypothetical protein